MLSFSNSLKKVSFSNSLSRTFSSIRMSLIFTWVHNPFMILKWKTALQIYKWQFSEWKEYLKKFLVDWGFTAYEGQCIYLFIHLFVY